MLQKVYHFLYLKAVRNFAHFPHLKNEGGYEYMYKLSTYFGPKKYDYQTTFSISTIETVKRGKPEAVNRRSLLFASSANNFAI